MGPAGAKVNEAQCETTIRSRTAFMERVVYRSRDFGENYLEYNLSKIEMQNLSSRLSLVYYFARLCNQDQTIEWSIWTLINITELCQCTDSRDRVYALLSMLHHNEAKSIVPDYLKSPCEVYKEVVLNSVDYFSRLTILQRCAYLKDAADWPTWITTS